jgi:uncharacterized protein YkwD
MRRALAIVVCGLVLSAPLAAPAPAAVGDCTPSSSWGTRDASLEAQVVQLVNQHRAALGLSQLSVASSLSASAGWKSLHMAGYNYMTHDDPAPPVARTVAQRLDACGYPSGQAAWGENIAVGYASAAAVMDGWLNDPPHKANIENASWTTIGVGAARASSGRLYWTQDFGTTGASSSPAPPAPSANAQAPAASTAPPAAPASSGSSQPSSAPPPSSDGGSSGGAATPAPAPAATEAPVAAPSAAPAPPALQTPKAKPVVHRKAKKACVAVAARRHRHPAACVKKGAHRVRPKPVKPRRA